MNLQIDVKYRKLLKNAAIIVAVFLFYRSYESKNDKIESQQTIIDVISDTLKVSRDNNGLQVTQISDLRLKSRKDLENIQKLNGTLKELQDLVKEKEGAYNAAVIKIKTFEDKSTKTIYVMGDTVRTDSFIYIYPTYNTSWNEKWSSGEIIANRDSVRRRISFVNELEFIQEYKREKFWKKKKGFATIKNRNPLTTTTDLRTYSLDNPQNKLILGPFIGINITGKPVLGIGVTYRLFGI